MKRLIAIQRAEEIVSPGVGRFSPKFYQDFQSNVTVLGIFERLGVRYELVLPQIVSNLELSASSFVMAGDVVARIHSNVLNNERICDHTTDDEHYILSPSDGFICLTDESGKYFVNPEDALTSGQIIAVLELMKVRVEICFDGALAARATHYMCSDKVAIRRGDRILGYTNIE